MVTKSKGSSVKYGMSRYSKAKVPTDLGRPYVKYQGGGGIPNWINPKNWGVSDYTDKYPDKDKAFAAARKAGEKEYLYKGVRYITNYNGTPQQQLKETGITNEQLQNRNFIQERLSNNLNPYGYVNAVNRVFDAVVKNKSSQKQDFVEGYERSTVPERNDAFRLYTGKPQKNNTFGISNYKPSKSTTAHPANYFTLNNFLNSDEEVDKFYNDVKQNKETVGNDVTQHYTSDIGRDERGKYVSYYDKWDLNPFKLKNPVTKKEITTDFGKPFEIYDRIHIKDYGDGQNKRMYYSDQELSKLDVDKKDFDTLALQRELTNRGYSLPKSTKEDGSFDGIWGNETKEALIDWQNSFQKKADESNKWYEEQRWRKNRT